MAIDWKDRRILTAIAAASVVVWPTLIVGFGTGWEFRHNLLWLAFGLFAALAIVSTRDRRIGVAAALLPIVIGILELNRAPKWWRWVIVLWPILIVVVLVPKPVCRWLRHVTLLLTSVDGILAGLLYSFVTFVFDVLALRFEPSRSGNVPTPEYAHFALAVTALFISVAGTVAAVRLYRSESQHEQQN
jgi:hypothetical protein